MRGSIVQRSRGSWTIILDLGYQVDSSTGTTKRKQKWVTVRGTKKEAEGKLNDLIKELRDGSYVDPSKLTLGAWLTTWIDLIQMLDEPAATPPPSGGRAVADLGVAITRHNLTMGEAAYRAGIAEHRLRHLIAGGEPTDDERRALRRALPDWRG